jgi:hypothetical protein
MTYEQFILEPRKQKHADLVHGSCGERIQAINKRGSNQGITIQFKNYNEFPYFRSLLSSSSSTRLALEGKTESRS